MELRLAFLLFLLPACSPKPVPHPVPITEEYPYNQSLRVTTLAAPNAANFTWQWVQAPSTPDIQGFVLSLGTTPDAYDRTVDIPGKDVRAYTATGLDLTKQNYAVMQSYTSFGLFSLPTPELVFGGQPTPPFGLGVAPGN